MRDWSPIIDTHAHVFLRDLPLVAGATHRPKYSFPVVDYLKLLDASGVLFGVLTAPSFLGSYNDYVLSILGHHRRLRGTAIVEPGIDPYALKAMAAGGIVGIRYSLRRYPDIPDFTQPEYRRLLRRVADLDWYVHLMAEADRLAVLVPQLVAADVKLVIDHFGVPDAGRGYDCPGFQAVQRALASGRSWVKVSAPYRVEGWDTNQLARKLLAEAGADRLLWGSDCPWAGFEGKFTYDQTIDWFEAAIPDRATREQIGRNGLHLNHFL